MHLHVDYYSSYSRVPHRAQLYNYNLFSHLPCTASACSSHHMHPYNTAYTQFRGVYFNPFTFNTYNGTMLFFFVYIIRLTYTIRWTYSFGYLLFTYTTLVPVRTGYV